MRMKMLGQLLLQGAVVALAPLGDPPLQAQGYQDASQASATQRQERGQNLPAREIERRIVPRMRGAQYLGFDYDPETNIYTLKFLRNGSVIWVDVNGRTGQVVRQAGN